jgi:hypothetical protein
VIYPLFIIRSGKCFKIIRGVNEFFAMFLTGDFALQLQIHLSKRRVLGVKNIAQIVMINTNTDFLTIKKIAELTTNGFGKYYLTVFTNTESVHYSLQIVLIHLH